MIVAKLQLEETDVTLMNFANSHQTSFASFYSVFLPLSKEEYRMWFNSMRKDWKGDMKINLFGVNMV